MSVCIIESLFGKMEQHMRVALKMAKKMDLVFLLIQEKVNLIFMKVFGKMTKDPEKEHFSGKMEQNMRETFKIVFTMGWAF